jgi:hypothetical protein
MQATHPDDASLVAFLDGELCGEDLAVVRDHLHSCWQCRARRSDLEAAILEVARLSRSGARFPPARLEEARQTFLHRASVNAAFAPKIRQTQVRQRWAIAVSLAGALALLTILLRLPSPGPSQPVEAQAVLTGAARTEEATLAKAAYAADLQVTVRYGQHTSTRRYRVVSDPENRRRLVDGAVIPASGASGAWWTELTQSTDLEQSLAAWMRSGQWEPVRLSANFARFVEATGAVLSIQRVDEESYRVVAERDLEDGRWRVVLDVAQPSLRPVSLSVDRGNLQWRVTPLSIRKLSSKESAAYFAPPVVTLGHNPAHTPAYTPASPDILPAGPEPVKTGYAEVGAVIHRLHRAGACVRDSVEVVGVDRQRMLRQPMLRVVAASTMRKRELEEALAEDLLPYVELRSLEEEPPRELPVRESSGLKAPGALAAQSLIASALGTSEQRAIINYADHAISLSRQALGEANAIHMLATLFPAEGERALSEAAREQLRGHLLAHAAAADVLLTSLDEYLQPIVKGRGQRVVKLPSGDAAWQARAVRAFEEAQGLHRDVLKMFAIGEAAGEEAVEEVLGKLSARLQNARALMGPLSQQEAQGEADSRP